MFWPLRDWEYPKTGYRPRRRRRKGTPTHISANQLEDAIAAGLDLGDGTANAEDALERGEEFSGPSPPVASEHPDAEAEGRKRAQVKATRDQIIQAVDRFNESIRSKAEARNITKFDILRLRAMLMIVAAAGQPGVRPTKAGKGTDHIRGTSLQVPSAIPLWGPVRW